MESFKEFQGSDLDECIQQAMEWFNSKRESLEVEIIQDAKTGIFGIVGARKAKIRARRARVQDSMRPFLEYDNHPGRAESGENPGKEGALRPGTQPRQGEPAGSKMNPGMKRGAEKHEIYEHGLKSEKKPQAPGEERNKKSFSSRPGRESSAARWSHSEEDAKNQGNANSRAEEAGDISPWPVIPIAELDQRKLQDLTLEIVRRLLTPLAGQEVELEFDLSHGYPRVKVAWDGDAGLLIGRDGQTLVAAQYLASRILSRQMESALKVRLDIGNYRTRQSAHLQDVARGLAEKARRTGRPCSTRPLTSYHRRVIHMALQEFPDIQTRSAGEGTLKRVVIAPKKG